MPLINPDCPGSAYPYCTSFPSAVVFAILYFTITVYAIFQYFRLKSWFYYWMLIAMLGEVAGLISRAIYAKDVKALHAFVVQYVLIIVCPSLMAAACYMAFGRLVWLITPYSKLSFRSLWIPPRWITPIFVTFDAVTFFIQMVGISAAATAIHEDHVETNQLQNGLRVAKVGLVLQLVCFLLFAVVGVHFLVVSKTWRVPFSRARRSQWQRLNLAINVAATLITIRALFRIIEFSASVGREEDQHGLAWYLYSNEWPAYVFDSLLIWLSVVIMNVIHPGEYLPEDFIKVRLIKKNVRQRKRIEEQGHTQNVPLRSNAKGPGDSVDPVEPPYAHLYNGNSYRSNH